MRLRSRTRRQWICLLLLAVLAGSIGCRTHPLPPPPPPPAPAPSPAPEPPPTPMPPPPAPAPAPPEPEPSPAPAPAPSPGPRHPAPHPPAPAPSPTPAEPGRSASLSEAEIDQALRRRRAELKAKNAVFLTPVKMTVGEVRSAQLALSARETLAELTRLLASREEAGETQALAGRIQVSSLVRATLRGEPAMTVAAQTDEEQMAEEGKDQLWRWNLTAVRPGRHSLTLTLTTAVRIDGTEKPMELEAWERRVEIVAVPPKFSLTRWMMDNLPFVLGTLVLPALGAGWKVLRDRKRKAPPAAAAVS